MHRFIEFGTSAAEAAACKYLECPNLEFKLYSDTSDLEAYEVVHGA